MQYNNLWNYQAVCKGTWYNVCMILSCMYPLLIGTTLWMNSITFITIIIIFTFITTIFKLLLIFFKDLIIPCYVSFTSSVRKLMVTKTCTYKGILFESQLHTEWRSRIKVFKYHTHIVKQMAVHCGKAEHVFDDHRECMNLTASTAKFYIKHFNALWVLLIRPIL